MKQLCWSGDMWSVYVYVVQGCDQNLAAIVDESCDATSNNLLSLCELIGRMSLQFGVAMSNFTDFGPVTAAHLQFIISLSLCL